MDEKNKPSKEELIGFHKGSISTLISERSELVRLVKVTESLIQAHAQELKNLGVEIEEQQDKKQK